MLKKRLVSRVTILVFLSLILYIFRPISFNKELFNSDKISIYYVINSMKDGKVTPEFKTLDFDKNSTEYTHIEKMIQKYTYHNCIKTLTGQKPSTNGQNIISIYKDNKAFGITNNNYIIIENKVYKMGHPWNSKYNSLYIELNDYLINHTKHVNK